MTMATAARPMLDASPATCEQVTVATDPRNIGSFAQSQEGGYVYDICSGLYATYHVEWSDDNGPDEMNMCTYHKDKFLEEEVPSRDDIRYTYVQPLDD